MFWDLNELVLADSQAQEEAALGGCGHPLGSWWGLCPTKGKAVILQPGLRSPAHSPPASPPPFCLCTAQIWIWGKRVLPFSMLEIKRIVSQAFRPRVGAGREVNVLSFSLCSTHSFSLGSDLCWGPSGALEASQAAGETDLHFINDPRARREACRETGREGFRKGSF